MTILVTGNLLGRYKSLLYFSHFFFNLPSVQTAKYYFFYLILQPSEQNTYADIEAVYKCLIDTYGASEDNIILYGQSVGSGPTLDLASHLPRLRAVVLHSPILSGLRVMYHVKHTYWFDIYKVINLQLS
jgi:dipeptidyl aminopeptidase/acylaminoacyl peptidase